MKIQVIIFVGVLFSVTALDVADAQEDANSARKAKPLVGAYYYPWYTKHKWDQVMRSHLRPPQIPAIGFHDSGSEQVIGQHIAQSVKANIDFWSVSWWGPGHNTDRILKDKILSHPDSKNLKYAIFYESLGLIGNPSHSKVDYSNFVDHFRYLDKHYFDDPRYLRIKGKPVVFVYLTRVLFRDSREGTEALSKLRKAFPNLYLVADEVFGPELKARHAKQWDAVTAYDVYGQSLKPFGATQAAIRQLRDVYTQCQKTADSVGTAFVPCVSPGFNDIAVRHGHPGRPRYFTDDPDSNEGDVFRAMIRDVALPMTDDRADRMMMVTSFNEWYEDTQIEATRGGFSETTKDDSATERKYTEGDRYVDYGNLYLEILAQETAADRN